MKKMYDGKKAKPKSMASIEPPDLKKVNALNDSMFSKKEDLFGQYERIRNPKFDTAVKTYTDVSKKDDKDDDLIVPAPVPKARGLKRGVKIGKVYVTLGKFIKVIFFTVLAFVLIDYMLPPFSNFEETQAIYKVSDDPFGIRGVNELKSYALANYSVYNENAFSSEQKSSYKLYSVDFKMRNYSPLNVHIPQMGVIGCNDKYKDRICYVTLPEDENEKILSIDLNSFETVSVRLNIMINVKGMSDKEIDEAITSLSFTSENMKKSLFGVQIPIIPAYVTVPDALTVEY